MQQYCLTAPTGGGLALSRVATGMHMLGNQQLTNLNFDIACRACRWRPAPGNKGGSLCNACRLHLHAYGRHRDASRASLPAKVRT